MILRPFKDQSSIRLISHRLRQCYYSIKKDIPSSEYLFSKVHGAQIWWLSLTFIMNLHNWDSFRWLVNYSLYVPHQLQTESFSEWTARIKKCLFFMLLLTYKRPFLGSPLIFFSVSCALTLKLACYKQQCGYSVCDWKHVGMRPVFEFYDLVSSNWSINKSGEYQINHFYVQIVWPLLKVKIRDTSVLRIGFHFLSVRLVLRMWGKWYWHILYLHAHTHIK